MRNWKSPGNPLSLSEPCVSFNEELKDGEGYIPRSKRKVSFNEELKVMDAKSILQFFNRVSFNEELKAEGWKTVKMRGEPWYPLMRNWKGTYQVDVADNPNKYPLMRNWKFGVSFTVP